MTIIRTPNDFQRLCHQIQLNDPSITIVNLGLVLLQEIEASFFLGYTIDDNDAKLLAESLSCNTTITEIYLNITSLSVRGAACLMEFIRSSPTLQILSLQGNYSPGAPGGGGVGVGVRRRRPRRRRRRLSNDDGTNEHNDDFHANDDRDNNNHHNNDVDFMSMASSSSSVADVLVRAACQNNANTTNNLSANNNIALELNSCYIAQTTILVTMQALTSRLCEIYCSKPCYLIHDTNDDDDEDTNNNNNKKNNNTANDHLPTIFYTKTIKNVHIVSSTTNDKKRNKRKNVDNGFAEYVLKHAVKLPNLTQLGLINIPSDIIPNIDTLLLQSRSIQELRYEDTMTRGQRHERQHKNMSATATASSASIYESNGRNNNNRKYYHPLISYLYQTDMLERLFLTVSSTSEIITTTSASSSSSPLSSTSKISPLPSSSEKLTSGKDILEGNGNNGSGGHSGGDDVDEQILTNEEEEEHDENGNDGNIGDSNDARINELDICQAIQQNKSLLDVVISSSGTGGGVGSSDGTGHETTWDNDIQQQGNVINHNNNNNDDYNIRHITLSTGATRSAVATTNTAMTKLQTILRKYCHRNQAFLERWRDLSFTIPIPVWSYAVTIAIQSTKGRTALFQRLPILLSSLLTITTSSSKETRQQQEKE